MAMNDQADTSSTAATSSPKTDPKHPFTLAIDVGATGLKASVLDADGAMVADRVKIATTYPMSPQKLIDDLTRLVAPLPDAERASMGFPGMVRAGRVLSPSHLNTKHGPGSHVDPDLVKEWHAFDLAGALTTALGRPTKVANDADIQGSAVATGQGFELVITLGTGFGTSYFYEGKLMPHMEFSHHPFRKGETYDEQLGEATRKEIGEERWAKRVHRAIRNMRELMFFDHLYIGGGNSRRLVRDELDDDVTIVDNTAGILGGIKLWETDHIGVNSTDVDLTS
jgi:polyphosphate glucokinase